MFKINDKFQLQFFRTDTKQERANLNVSQDGAECRRLRQNSKAAAVATQCFFVCLQAFIAARKERSSFGMNTAMKCIERDRQ